MADSAMPKADPIETHQVQELKHNSPLIGCRFDPSGRYILASAQDNMIIGWDLESGKKAYEMTGHKSWVRAIAFAAKEQLVFSGDYTGRLLAWPVDQGSAGDSSNMKPAWDIPAHQGWVRALAVSPDGKLLASAGNDQRVKLWSIPDGKLVKELVGHGSHVYQIAFHPDGKHLASIELMGVVKDWDIETGKSVRDLDAKILHKYDPTFRADIGGARGMTFSPDGSRLACAGITDVSNAFAGIGKPLILLYNWADGKPQQLRPKVDFRGTAWGVVYHPAGFVAAVGGGTGGGMWFWKPNEAQSFHMLKFPANARDLDLHPDGLRLGVAFQDGAVRVFSMTKKPAPAKKEAAPKKK